MSTTAGALRRSTGRFVLYTSWSLYSMLLTELLVALLLLLGAAAGGWQLVVLLSLVALHTATNCAWLRWSLRTLRRPVPLTPRLRVLLVAWLVLTVALMVLSPLVMGWPRSAWPVLVLVVGTFAVSAFAPRLSWWLVPSVPMVVMLACLAIIRPWSGEDLLAIAVGLLLTGIAFSMMAATVWLTGWMLGVVYALDDARGQSAQLAIAEERLRISRDLHDVFGRTLATVAVKSELAAELARRGRSDRAAEEMAQVRAVADDAGKEVRRIVAGVRGSDLPQELVGARSLLASAGVDCQVTDQVPEGRLRPGTGAVLGAVVREAVTNVLRHSRARTATIALRLLPAPAGAVVELKVRNDGVRTGPDGGGGHGLVGMAERLQAVGGSLHHERDGAVFLLTARVPVEPFTSAAPVTSGADDRPSAAVSSSDGGHVPAAREDRPPERGRVPAHDDAAPAAGPASVRRAR